MKKKSRIYLRATPEEKREFKKLAKAADMTLSEWLLNQCRQIITLPVENPNE